MNSGHKLIPEDFKGELFARFQWEKHEFWREPTYERDFFEHPSLKQSFLFRENILSPKEINYLKHIMKQEKSTPLYVQTDWGNGYSPQIQKSVRNGLSLDVSREFFSIAKKLIFPTIENIYEEKIGAVSKMLGREYKEGGCYELHFDNGGVFQAGNICYPEVLTARDLTILTCVEDDHTGGELEFPQQGKTFRLSKGSSLIFPSNFHFSHQLHPITSGKRVTIVFWVQLFHNEVFK